MKKLNITEADVIVGGTCKEKTCSVKYARGAGGACMAVTTCLDKHGKVASETSAPADAVNCVGLP